MSTQVYNATGGGLIGLFPNPVISTRDPTTTDTVSPTGAPYQIFQGWNNKLTDATFIYLGGGIWVTIASIAGAVTQISGNTGVAIPVGGNVNVVGAGTLSFAGSGSTLTGTITPGTGLISTLTGDSGGARSPTAGNMNLLGTVNQITVTGAASTLTWSISATFIAPGSIASTSTITAATGLTVTSGGATVTAGDITATAGNLIATVGNLDLNGAASKININVATGASASAGVTAAMTGGAVTVTSSAVTANSIIMYARKTLGTAMGNVSITAQAGGSFTLTSDEGTETSTFNWWLIN